MYQGDEAFHTQLPTAHQFRVYGYKTFRGSRRKFAQLKSAFANYLQKQLGDYAGGSVTNFEPEMYHEELSRLQVGHHDFIGELGRKLPESFLIDPFISDVISIAEAEFGHRFQIYKSNVEFRVVRPGSEDNNELHRDHWFPYFTPLVNIYIPISSSYYDSSLGIVPFSHEWTETDVVPTHTYEESAAGKKFLKNGVYYSVPAIAHCTKPIQLHRPDLTEGDFMLFSPKLIHGGGTNGSIGTRFSLEIRLERVGA